MAAEDLLNVLDDPRRIFNLNEIGFFLFPKRGEVLARRGTKQDYTVAGGSNREMITVLLGANAQGDSPPPMIVFNCKRIPANIQTNIPESMAVGLSSSGWMKADTFYDYIVVHFLPWIKENEIPLPIVIFVDGHASHVSLTLSEFCDENQIILIALYPNATHVLQPMDVGVFSNLKNKWQEARGKWSTDNRGVDFDKTHFLGLLKQTLDSVAVNHQIFLNSFRICGNIYFN